MWKAISVLALSAMLAACTSITVPPEKLNQYKRIGVLSAIGDDFQTTVMGLTIFGNDQQTMRLDIGVDETLTQAAVQALSPHYTVVDLSHHRSEFLKTPVQWPDERVWWTEDRPLVPDRVRELMASENLDAYVVITPHSVGRGSGSDIKEKARGIGIFSISLLNLPERAFIYTAFKIGVVDGRDYTRVARNWDLGRSETGGGPLNAPHMPVPATWRQNPTEHKDEIRQTVDTLISRSVPRTLKELGLHR